MPGRCWKTTFLKRNSPTKMGDEKAKANWALKQTRVAHPIVLDEWPDPSKNLWENSPNWVVSGFSPKNSAKNNGPKKIHRSTLSNQHDLGSNPLSPSMQSWQGFCHVFTKSFRYLKIPKMEESWTLFVLGVLHKPYPYLTNTAYITVRIVPPF